jgi:hypothetical protein
MKGLGSLRQDFLESRGEVDSHWLNLSFRMIALIVG